MTDTYRTPNIITRCFISLIGANPERTAWAGHDDQARFRLIGMTVLGLFAWVGFNVANALSFATGSGFGDFRVMALAVLIAGLYVAVDLSLLQGRLWANGVRLAQDRGFAPVRHSRVARMGRAFANMPFALLRIGLAVTVALFAAFSFGLWYWDKDITAQLHADQRDANAALQTRIETEIEHDLRTTTSEIAEIQARMSARASSRQSAHDQATAGIAAQRSQLQSRLATITQQEAALQTQIACVARNIKAEEEGLIDCAGVKRTAGKLGRWRAAQSEHAQLTTAIARLASERAGVEQSLQTLVPPTLVTVDDEAPRLAILQSRRAEILETRAQRVADQMQADPGYVPRADGLLRRQATLIRLAQEEDMVLAMLLVTKVMFVLLDLSVLGIAFGQGPASVYALQQVIDIETRSADAIAEGHIALANAAARTAEADQAMLVAEIARRQASRELRAEMRRIDFAEATLDHFYSQFDPSQQPRPRFDA